MAQQQPAQPVPSAQQPPAEPAAQPMPAMPVVPQSPTVHQAYWPNPNFYHGSGEPAVFQQPQQPQPQQAQGSPNAPGVPTPPIAFQQTISQQNEQIEALMAQNAALNAQVVSLINNGAQMPAQQPQQQQQAQVTPAQNMAQQMQIGQFPNIYEPFNPSSLASGQDYSLEGLASEIGHRD